MKQEYSQEEVDLINILQSNLISLEIVNNIISKNPIYMPNVINVYLLNLQKEIESTTTWFNEKYPDTKVNIRFDFDQILKFFKININSKVFSNLEEIDIININTILVNHDIIWNNPNVVGFN